ncbi:MAG: flavodoxin domain-containing protein, partial [Verrucomicrobiales bacterium]
MSISVPFVPETAPFTTEQRQWLNGFLAGMFTSQDSVPVDESPTASKGRAVILYGSQSGNAESLSESFSEQLVAAGFDAPVVDMADHDEIDLSKEKHVIIVTSTWGEGDPPDNAVEFWEKLSAGGHPALDGLKFGVCGLGDSNYLDFCGMGKRFDARLEELGASRLLPRVDCDVDFEETAGAWGLELLVSLGGTSATPSAVSEGSTQEREVFSKKNPFPAPLLKNVSLNGEQSERDTRHFEISLDGAGLEYEAG